jgi:hypothetical protein
MYGLRHRAEAEGRRLLRLLFIRYSEMSANPTAAWVLASQPLNGLLLIDISTQKQLI